MESQTPGVQWPTVTRPADNADALLLLSAPRMCVCGHPVYDEGPRCRLCACQEHKPKLPAVGGHSTPAAVSPGNGEAGRRPQPDLPRGRPDTALARQHAAARNLCLRTLLASDHPGNPPLLALPGRGPSRARTAPCGRDRTRCRESRRPGASGPAVAASPQLARHANIRRTLLSSLRSLGLALNRVRTEVPSGLALRAPAAADTATGRTLALSRASTAGSWCAWGASASDASAMRVPFASRLH